MMMLAIICFSQCAFSDLEGSSHVLSDEFPDEELIDLSIEDFKIITEEEFNHLSYEYRGLDKVTISTGIKLMKYTKEKNYYLVLIIEPEATQGIVQIAFMKDNAFYLHIFDTSTLSAEGSKFVINSDDFMILKYDFIPNTYFNEVVDCENEMYYYEFDLQWFSGLPLQESIKVNLAPLFINNYLVVGFFSPEAEQTSASEEDVQEYNKHLSDIEIFVGQTGLFKHLNWNAASGILTTGSDGKNVAYTIVWLQTNEPKKCSELKEMIRMLEEEPMVAYAGLVFKPLNRKCLCNNCPSPCSEINLMGDFPFISVSLINGSDMSDLYAITQETNTKILHQSGNAFTVIADKYANGSAIQMANYFSETGKFTAQPWFKFTYDSNYASSLLRSMAMTNSSYLHLNNGEFLGLQVSIHSITPPND